MHRLIVSILLISFLVLPIFGSPTTGSAALYTIVATSVNPRVSDFTLTYNDTDNDTPVPLFGPQEGDTVVTFSGFEDTLVGHVSGPVNYAPVNSSMSPFTDGSGVFGFGPNYWGFGPLEDVLVLPASSWTYTQAAVPIPASALLLSSGLIPLAWFRRRNLMGK
jgi:hypothetical protein